MRDDIQYVIKKCISEDREAQKELFTILAPRLLSIARRYSSEFNDPKDILQDSFIKIYNRLVNFDNNKGSIISWASKIVINTALDKIKQNNKDIFLSGIENIDIIDKDTINENSDIEYIMVCIEKLPDGYKQVFCLYEIDGYTHKEISEMLNIKEATSRSQLNRSKQILRNWLFNSVENSQYNII